MADMFASDDDDNFFSAPKTTTPSNEPTTKIKAKTAEEPSSFNSSSPPKKTQIYSKIEVFDPQSHSDSDLSKICSVKIPETEIRTETNLTGKTSPYVVYLIEVHPAENMDVKIKYSTAWRRFSDFDLIRSFLLATHPSTIVPVVPSKTMQLMQKSIKRSLLQPNKQSADDRIENFSNKLKDPEFIESRRLQLQRFLNKCLENEKLSRNKEFWEFLQGHQDYWKTTLTNSGYEHKLNAMKKHGDETDKNGPFEKLKEKEFALKEVLVAYNDKSMSEFSMMNVYSNYKRVIENLSEIQPAIRKELAMTAPVMDLFLQQSRKAQLAENNGPLSDLTELERTMRKSIREGIGHHYLTAQHEAIFAEKRLSETKNERAELQHGGIPTNLSSLRGLGSMMKAAFESNIERESRSNKLERRENLESQLAIKTSADFQALKSACTTELANFEEYRKSTIKSSITSLIRHRLEYLKSTNQTWQEIQDIMQ